MSAEDGKSHRVQIYIAMIGVAGVLGAAAIGNWDKLFPREREETTSEQGPSTSQQDPSTSANQNSSTPTSDCAIILDTPKDGATVKQRKLDSGRIEAEFSFAWRHCPNATKYHLVLSTPDGSKKIIDDDSLTFITLSRKRRDDKVIQPRGWIWKVRPFIDGEWKAWSEPRTLYVSPPS